MSKATKILESALVDPNWLAGEREYEIRRLEAILRNGGTDEEMRITAEMLSFYQS